MAKAGVIGEGVMMSDLKGHGVSEEKKKIFEEGVEYGVSDFKARIEAFKDLEVKYVESALFFLANLAEASQSLTQLYSKSKWLWRIMKIRIALMIIGDGITQLVHSQKTKFGRLIMWLISPLLGLSIISVTLWTSIRKKKKK